MAKKSNQIQTIVKDSPNLNPRLSNPFPKLLISDESNLLIPEPEDDINISDPADKLKLSLASMVNHHDEEFVPEVPNIEAMNAVLLKVNQKNSKVNSNKNNQPVSSMEEHQPFQSATIEKIKVLGYSIIKTDNH